MIKDSVGWERSREGRLEVQSMIEMKRQQSQQLRSLCAFGESRCTFAKLDWILFTDKDYAQRLPTYNWLKMCA
jgi:hypothetical protein